MDNKTNNKVGKRRRSIEGIHDNITENNHTEVGSPPRHLRKIIHVHETNSPQSKTIQSPFQLTRIRDLPKSLNADSVSLHDILGNPIISECWNFNYLHDLDFLIRSFDQDVQHLVKIHVIHGFWKREDPNRHLLEKQALKYPNVTLHTAFMPEMFGTHHSKMFVLFRHDETAQIIIHTANITEFDWTNMTQGLWRSPLLKKLSKNSPETSVSNDHSDGSKFKLDLLNYLKAYDNKSRKKICEGLSKKLEPYDFSSIRAALVASVPGKHVIHGLSRTLWGWARLQDILRSVDVKNCSSKPEIIIQVSSIATLGTTNEWLEKTFFKALKSVKNDSKDKVTEPEFKVIFPTNDEIRRSLNGYDSGNAIHIKIHTPAQQKQMQYLKPLLCCWAGDGTTPRELASNSRNSDAGRKRAAPHIKTYIRFSDSKKETIDWVLLTSANLSRQAWGDSINAAGIQRICSYETGVLVWPSLYGTRAKFVPTFQIDKPSLNVDQENNELVIGIRMPYGLPVISYGDDIEPWCASSAHTEPDWMGRFFNSFQI